ncbi:MAG: transcription antitermination factor NusB [Pseudomonadota bacterium]
MAATAKPMKMQRSSAARATARKLALQALYQWQLNNCPWQDLLQEYMPAADTDRADKEYLRVLLQSICTDIEALDTQLGEWTDRKAKDLDPIEHAALLIGLQELRAQPDVPYRVAISEAVSLTRRFGATDGHKFVNAVLDRAARSLRPLEH